MWIKNLFSFKFTETFSSRKHDGQSLVCDESIYTEDSGNVIFIVFNHFYCLSLGGMITLMAHRGYFITGSRSLILNFPREMKMK